MPKDAKRIFDAAARTYDPERRKLVPRFDHFYGTVIQLLTGCKARRPRVLDLGAGTGLLAAMVADAFPQARLTLIDFSSEMLAQARQRFSDRKVPIEIIVADYSRSELGGPYDAIVSALSIHHLHHAAKRRLYRKAFESLKAGGLFINADQVLGPTPKLEACYQQDWVETVRRQGASERQIAGAMKRMQADQPSTLSAQLGWLERAGFQHVDCSFKSHRFAVMSGIRSSK